MILIDKIASDLAARAGHLAAIGIDLVHLPRVAESLAAFGERFERKLFTQHELDYVHGSKELALERLAARFAAKEAAIKALGLAHVGVDWKDLEVHRHPGGACELRLHGRAAAHVGPVRTLLSLSHDGEYAAAVVAVLSDKSAVAGSPECPHEQSGTG